MLSVTGFYLLTYQLSKSIITGCTMQGD